MHHTDFEKDISMIDRFFFYSKALIIKYKENGFLLVSKVRIQYPFMKLISDGFL